jgi:hypothetical protein
MKAGRVRRIVPVLLVAAVALGVVAAASGAGERKSVTPPAGSPDLSLMALRVADLPAGARVAKQRYVRTRYFVAEYDREFKQGTVRLGGKRLLLLESDIALAASVSRANSMYDEAHAMVSTKDGRRELARQAAKSADLSAKSVTVGRPVSLHVGDESFAAVVRFSTPFGSVYTVIAMHRTDRVLSMLTIAGGFGTKMSAASAKTFARPIALHVHDGLLPANTAPPSITGTAVVGQTLTVLGGTWTSKPTSYAYQWQRCDAAGATCVDIAGASQQTYAVQQDDLGSTLRVVETATNTIGSTSVASTQTAVVIPPPPAV